MSLIIRKAHILTQDGARRHLVGDVHVDNGVIRQVGHVKARADEVIDGSRKLLIPGLVNAHTHLPMVLFRGWGDDLPLEEWLKTRIWPAEDRLDEAAIRAGTRLALLELIASGTTTFNDMYFYEDAVAQEADKAGLRGWAGFGMVDTGKVEGDAPNPKLPECERFVQKWAEHPRIRAAPAPHATYTCGPKTYAQSYQMAERFDALVHTHLSETRSEVYELENQRGARPPKYLEQAQCLGPRSVLAHCGWITKDEVRSIAQAGAGVAHCPVSNMKLATGGTCPVPEFLEAGAAVGLGTDGAASNNTLDLFETMKFASLLHKHLRWDARLLPAQTTFDLATREGARVLRWQDRIGSIEVGKRADLVLLDLDSPRMQPLHDPVSQIVYAAQGGDVHATIVDGRILKLADDYRTLKPDKVLEAARRAAERLTKPD